MNALEALKKGKLKVGDKIAPARDHPGKKHPGYKNLLERHGYIGAIEKTWSRSKVYHVYLSEIPLQPDERFDPDDAYLTLTTRKGRRVEDRIHWLYCFEVAK